MARLGCRAIFVNSTSGELRGRADGRLAGLGVLVVHTVLNEGGGVSPTVVRFGERPSGPARGAGDSRPWRRPDARRWFLVGHSYVWSHGAHAAARRAIYPRRGARSSTRCWRPLGTRDFSDVVRPDRGGRGPT